MAEKLATDDIAAKLQDMPDWTEINGSIQRTYAFPDFLKSIDFTNKLAAQAEEVQHHPDILIRYNKVTLTLSTHDAGGITDKDFDLATFDDNLA